MLMTDLQHLTDDELVFRIASLNGAAKEATASLVAHLAELESRDLHLALGFRSLYGYCRAVLRLSEHESYNRMEAAHVVRRFPAVVPMLAEGLLHLTAVRLLGPHLQDENHLALLGGAIHKSRAEVKALLAAWFPKADVGTSIRRTAMAPAAKATITPQGGGASLFAAAPTIVNDAHANGDVGKSEATHGEATQGEATRGEATKRDPRSGSVPPAFSGTAPRKATIDPLSAETYALRLTARRATIERLRRAQEILSHAVPNGDVDEILYRALGALIEREGRRMEAPARRRRRRIDRATDPTSRTVSAEVERHVRRRDEDRCAFVSRDGRRCEERRFLELHHLRPWIAGGEASTRNIALRCRAHNQYEWKAYVAPIRKAQEMLTTR
jgi:hypothetical protein